MNPYLYIGIIAKKDSLVRARILAKMSEEAQGEHEQRAIELERYKVDYAL